MYGYAAIYETREHFVMYRPWFPKKQYSITQTYVLRQQNVCKVNVNVRKSVNMCLLIGFFHTVSPRHIPVAQNHCSLVKKLEIKSGMAEVL